MSSTPVIPRAAQLYQALSTEERQRFTHYITRYRKERRERLHKLCRLLARVSPDSYVPRKLYGKLLPRKVFSEAVLNRQLSDFTQVIERFLVEQELRTDDQLHGLLLRRALRRRGLVDLARVRLNEVRKDPEEWSSQGLLTAYYQAWEAFEDRHSEKRLTSYVDDLQELVRRLDDAYALERCLLEIPFEDRYKNLVNTPKEGSYAPLSEVTVLSDHPAVAVARALQAQYRSYSTERETWLLEQLPEVIKRSNNRIASILLLLMNNLLHRRLKAHPNTGYQLHIFNFYRLGLDRSFLTRNGLMTPATFLNIVNVGLEVGQHEWVAALIERDSVRFSARFDEKVKRLARAQLHLHRAELSAAEAALIEPFGELTLNLRARSKILQLYYLQSLHNDKGHDKLLDSLERFRLWMRSLRKQDYNRLIKNDYLAVADVLEEVLMIRVDANRSRIAERAEALRVHVAQKEVVLPGWLRRVVSHL